MKILSLGNEFIKEDSLAKKISKELSEELPDFEFININDSFQLIDYLQEEGRIIILDVVENLKEVKLLDVNDLKENKILSLHDFDAGFFLQLLGKGKNIKIIGLPMNGKIESIKREAKNYLNLSSK